MYAVIRSGGKQYRVAPGETVEVERLEGKVGGKVTFDNVIAVSNDDKKLISGGDIAKAKAAYEDFLTLWKDADPDIPILKQAKAEYAKL